LKAAVALEAETAFGAGAALEADMAFEADLAFEADEAFAGVTVLVDDVRAVLLVALRFTAGAFFFDAFETLFLRVFCDTA
jgi:hypothetical protein